jgi:hypothetical protein
MAVATSGIRAVSVGLGAECGPRPRAAQALDPAWALDLASACAQQVDDMRCVMERIRDDRSVGERQSGADLSDYDREQYRACGTVESSTGARRAIRSLS